eukprot:5128019-Pyramimonas_sp.AAC.1
MVKYLSNLSKTDSKSPLCPPGPGRPTSPTPRRIPLAHRCRRALRGISNLRKTDPKLSHWAPA